MNDFYLHPQVTRYDELSEQLRSLAKFRRALRKEDQDALDDLIEKAKARWNLGDKAPHLTPIEFMLLSMVLEERREVEQLQSECNTLCNNVGREDTMNDPCKKLREEAHALWEEFTRARNEVRHYIPLSTKPVEDVIEPIRLSDDDWDKLIAAGKRAESLWPKLVAKEAELLECIQKNRK